MRRSVIFFIFFNFTIFILMTSCGIEDTVYLKEPSIISVSNYDDNVQQPYITFYGYNWEKNGDYYIFLGYDLFYYFTTVETAKKAMVYKPYPYLNKTTPGGGTNEELITTEDIRGNREVFDSLTDSTLSSIYRYITFPVTENMITETLREANTSNVKMFFYDIFENDTLDFANPFTSSEDYIAMDCVYPNWADYPDDWKTYDEEDDNDKFKGFLDYRFYEDNNISKSKEENGYYVYKCTFYLVSQGFENNTVSSLTNLTSSLNSTSFTVEFYVLPKK